MENDNKAFHETQAKSCFNKTWDFIEMTDRSLENDLDMIHHAHASRYHWGIVGQPLHHERGEWLISKVYYTLGKGQSALYHAQACMKICLENNIKDFDIAFAYEAMANAYKLLGDMDQKEAYRAKAYDCLDDIQDKGDRDYTESELKKI